MVTFSIEELFGQIASFCADKRVTWGDGTGNMIMRAAWHVIGTKLQPKIEEIASTNVVGKGKVTVTLFNIKEDIFK